MQDLWLGSEIFFYIILKIRSNEKKKLIIDEKNLYIKIKILKG